MEVQENKPQEQQFSSEQLHEVDYQQLEDIQGGGGCLSRFKVPSSTNVLPVGDPLIPRLQRSVSYPSLSQPPIGREPSFRDWLPKPKLTLMRSLSSDSGFKMWNK